MLGTQFCRIDGWIFFIEDVPTPLQSPISTLLHLEQPGREAVILKGLQHDGQTMRLPALKMEAVLAIVTEFKWEGRDRAKRIFMNFSNPSSSRKG